MSGRRYLDEGHKPNVPVFFTVPPELHDAIAGTAKEIGIPVSEFCRTALKAFLADLEEKESEIERERAELIKPKCPRCGSTGAWFFGAACQVNLSTGRPHPFHGEDKCQKSTLQRSYTTASGPAQLATRITK